MNVTWGANVLRERRERGREGEERGGGFTDTAPNTCVGKKRVVVTQCDAWEENCDLRNDVGGLAEQEIVSQANMGVGRSWGRHLAALHPVLANLFHNG
ncbi:hypothetical protein E2C01_054093 [Portunus trituberculatus]|uniref:Uncharacterized protein n=1 Tax=Portunus trituberculatus TaxID=210409 RepID=A0A5B7GS90_PORTR|nr:hypothetical protein [Portunus trituberculatus]